MKNTKNALAKHHVRPDVAYEILTALMDDWREINPHLPQGHSSEAGLMDALEMLEEIR